MSSRHFKSPIPKGYRIFFGAMSVAGVGFRKSEVAKAFDEAEVSLKLEPDPQNAHDPNALKVVALKEGIFRTRKLHIGYVPKEIAKTIAEKNIEQELLLRAQSVWVGDKGGMDVVIDILGPKSEHHKLKDAE
ncbi:HIRAN domain-containing protein [Microbulbifer sp. JTAC008]|uniref:HIRAN domain-containing protein n=1 Tax=unclassified Microbulbifer TaxID=2619833 RepID=UPI004039987E